MKPDPTRNARQARARQSLAESGGRTVTVKLDRASSDALHAICATGVDQQSVVRDAIVLAHKMRMR